MLTVGKRQETNLLSKEDKKHWINHHVERQTAVARKRVDDAERVIKQQKEDSRNAENA